VEEAARWLARRDRGLTSAEQQALVEWCEASPRHAVELARLETTWHTCDLAKASPKLASLAVELDRATTGYRRFGWQTWAGVAAAIAVCALGFSVWQYPRPDVPLNRETARTYQVLPSGARQIAFEDGSTAQLRDDTEILAEFTGAERRVRLLRGEAHFTVVRDAQRPFIVAAREATVQAVGTSFNVRLDPGHVEVVVTEGRVQVREQGEVLETNHEWAPLVSAGERAVIERKSETPVVSRIAITPAERAEVEQAVAWQSVRLVFSRTPLSEAVEAFNQNAPGNSGVLLVLGDDSLRGRRLGGTFRAGNVEGFVRLLEQTANVRVERRGSEIVLLPVP
jgi:transmembrane sensor